MKESPFIIKKIPLKDFIPILIDLYNQGANYIDLIGKANGQEDIIQISVRSEYMQQEEEPNILTEEDFDNLII